MLVNGICSEHSTSHAELTYVRHDFLVGAHGRFYFQSNVCAYWRDLAATQDVIIMSFGAHVRDMIEYPNQIEAEATANASLIIDSSAEVVAEQMRKMPLKPDVIVIYLTAGGGIENFTRDCTEPPAHKPWPYEKRFAWNWIPYAQKRYVLTIGSVMKERSIPFLVMDTQHLSQMRRGCRYDFVHSSTREMESPMYHTWLVLYNLLSEYRMTQEK